MDITKEVSRFMVNFGFPPNINGYHYVKESIIFAIENQTITSNKLMFSHLAEKYNTDVDNIERCVRTMVDKTWAHLVQFGLFDKRPTPREFIHKCAEFIKLGIRQPSVYDILDPWY